MERTFILRGPEQAKALHGFLKANASAMAAQGRPLAVEVREHKAKRSSRANRRYWALLRFIASNAWIGGKQFADETFHEWFKRRFIGTEELPDGQSVGISTTKLDVGEFTAYMERIEQCASEELGIDMGEFV